MRPHLDALRDRNGLRETGDHDGGGGLEGRSAAESEGDDVFSRMARLLEAPVELDGEILIEENPHRGSGDLLDGWRQVSGNVSRIPNGGEDLVAG